MVAVHYIDAETGGILGCRIEDVLPEEGARISLDGIGECLILNYWEMRPESCDVYARRTGAEETAALA